MDHYDVRLIEEPERRAAYNVLLRSLHYLPPTDEEWAQLSPGFPAGRAFAAFDGKAPVGVASSFGTELAVPGGKQLPTAAVDGVGVRTDHRRRGVFSRLMRTQLEDCRARGDVLAVLRASEATIYGRVGYGVATSGTNLRVSLSQATMRGDAPTGSDVHLLDAEDAIARLPEIYRRIAPNRTGMIGRPAVWWAGGPERALRHERDRQVAIHIGTDGPDGFVMYQTVASPSDDHEAMVRIRDMHAADTSARAGLWRFLLGIDLVREVEALSVPVDEPLSSMLVNPRACQVTALEDQLWLRLLDVPAALRGREYGTADPVVLEVEDPLLPENSGRYRIGPDGARRTEETAAIRLDLDTLAMMYLGEYSPAFLSATGRISTQDSTTLANLDELFTTRDRPWCGTNF